MNNTEYTINYKLEVKDYYEFNKWYYIKILKLLLPVIIILYLINYIFEYKNLLNFNFSGTIIHTASFIIFISILFLGLIISIKIRSKMIFKQDKILNSQVKLLIADDYIDESTEKSNLKINWTDLKKIVVRNKYIYFMISNIRGIILPVRVIDDNKIIEFIKSKVNK